MTENYAIQAIQAVLSSQKAYCKFLSANDTGLTGGHQAGIYISKPSIPILFDEPGEKGQNKEKWVKIKWQGGTETDTRFIYYGQGTRNEYRITNFGRGFPFLKPEYTGALFVLTQNSPEDYQSYILNTEDDIDPVSYTHLDVYKRQRGERIWRCGADQEPSQCRRASGLCGF